MILNLEIYFKLMIQEKYKDNVKIMLWHSNMHVYRILRIEKVYNDTLNQKNV